MTQPQNYKNFWDDKATTYTGALIAVDGSSNEAALDLGPQSRVLEIGCGVARIGLPLADQVGFWQGVDISANMVAVAQQRLAGKANVNVQALTGPRLPFADASFDAVYSIAVFIHMDKEDFFLYLREAHRVLKPGGRLFFDHWNLAHPVGLKRFLYEANFYGSQGDFTSRKDVARNQFSTGSEITAFLSHLGFGITGVMTDTPWVQACAIKADGDALDEECLRIAGHYDVINYGEAWTTYFDWVLPVVFEGVHPKVILERLTGEPQGEVRSMYETWLHAAWRNNPTQYGAHSGA
jgi:SAM-dependent methyltransferase